MPKKNTEQQYEEILVKIGDYGRYQKRYIFFFAMQWAAGMGITFVHLFCSLDPEKVSVVAHASPAGHIQDNLPEVVVKSYIFDKVGNKEDSLAADVRFDKLQFCDAERIYEFDNGRLCAKFTSGQMSFADSAPEALKMNNERGDDVVSYYAYIRPEDYHYSIVTMYDLFTCTRRQWVPLGQFFFFMGYGIGNLTFPFIGDRYGRLVVFHLTMFILISGLFWVYFIPEDVRGASYSRWPYSFFGEPVHAFNFGRFLKGWAMGGNGMVCYLLCSEMHSGATIQNASLWMGLGCVFGVCALCLLATYNNDYFFLHYCLIAFELVIYSSSVLVFRIRESPKWLLAKGRLADFTYIMNIVAGANGSTDTVRLQNDENKVQIRPKFFEMQDKGSFMTVEEPKSGDRVEEFEKNDRDQQSILSQGQIEAVAYGAKSAYNNDITFDDHVEEGKNHHDDLSTASDRENVDYLKAHWKRNLVVLSLVWFATSFSSYGISIGAENIAQALRVDNDHTVSTQERTILSKKDEESRQNDEQITSIGKLNKSNKNKRLLRREDHKEKKEDQEQLFLQKVSSTNENGNSWMRDFYSSLFLSAFGKNDEVVIEENYMRRNFDSEKSRIENHEESDYYNYNNMRSMEDFVVTTSSGKRRNLLEGKKKQSQLSASFPYVWWPMSVPGLLFVNYVAETFAIVWSMRIVTWQSVGRRGSTCWSLWATGGVLFLCAISMRDPENPLFPNSILFSLVQLGKFTSSITFTVIYVYGSECFSTSIRNRAMGVQSLCARIAAMFAPTVCSFEKYNNLPGISLALFALVSIVSAFFAQVLLPETLKKPLAATKKEEDHNNVGGERIGAAASSDFVIEDDEDEEDINLTPADNNNPRGQENKKKNKYVKLASLAASPPS